MKVINNTEIIKRWGKKNDRVKLEVIQLREAASGRDREIDREVEREVGRQRQWKKNYWYINKLVTWEALLSTQLTPAASETPRALADEALPGVEWTAGAAVEAPRISAHLVLLHLHNISGIDAQVQIHTLDLDLTDATWTQENGDSR